MSRSGSIAKAITDDSVDFEAEEHTHGVRSKSLGYQYAQSVIIAIAEHSKSESLLNSGN